MYNRPIRRAPAAAGALLLLPLSVVTGATIDWIGHGTRLTRIYDGTFSDAFNWNTGVVPGASDTAEFNAKATYTVTFILDASNAGLLVPGGAVTFSNSGSRTYRVGSAAVEAV